MQTGRASLAEAITNTCVGCVVAYIIVLAVLLVDSSPSSAAAWSVGLNIPASAARSFLLRRFFDRTEK
jgi:hypothetical protein